MLKRGVLRLGDSCRKHRDAWLLAGVVLLAAAVRVGLLLGTERVVWGDEPSYLWLGRNWITGRGFTFTGRPDPHHSPLYPMVTGLLYLLTGDMERSSDICYVLFGALLAVPIFLLARRIYDRGTGLWAALVVSLYPALTGAVLFWGTMTEPLYLLLCYVGFYAALVAVEEEWLWGYPVAGACIALAYLTRPEAIGYLAGMVLFWLGVLVVERRLLSRRSLGGLALYAGAFLALVFPYAVFVHGQTGSWQITEKAGVTFITCLGLATHDVAAFDRATWGLDSTGHEVFFFSDESYNVSMVDYVREHPGEFARLVVQNVRAFLNYLISPRMLPSLLVPVVALGLWAVPWGRSRLRRELWLGLTVLPLAGFALFFIQERYIGAVLPTLTIWVAVGLRHLGRWCADTWANLSGRGRRLGGALRVAPLVAVLVWFVVALPAEMRGTSVGSYRLGHKTVGLWLGERVTPETVVMSRYPAIAFYAGTVWRPTPNASVDEMLEYARYKTVDYLVLDERETVQMRPQFRPLLDGVELPAPLERVHVDASEGERLVVFRLHW